MSRLVIVLISVVAVASVPATVQSQSAAVISKQFVGVWGLVSWTKYWDDGTSTRDRRSVGFLIYTEGGHMCWTGMDPNRPQWNTPDNPTDAELASTFLGAAAYCSRVEIHADEGFVLHHVQSAIWPLTDGFIFKRTFEFDGPNRLILSEDPAGLAPPAVGSVLVWERLE